MRHDGGRRIPRQLANIFGHEPHPGRVPIFVNVWWSDGTCTVVPVTEQLPAVDEDTPVPAEPTDCERDVLEVMRTAGRRLTTAQILSALSAADKFHGERTVQLVLRRLVESGAATVNRCKPYGYALAD